jgi:hypothetical protein
MVEVVRSNDQNYKTVTALKIIEYTLAALEHRHGLGIFLRILVELTCFENEFSNEQNMYTHKYSDRVAQTLVFIRFSFMIAIRRTATNN